MREQGHVVDIISKTHVATRNFDADCVTADHWVHKCVKNGQPKCRYLFVDELSQINVLLWCHISLVKARGVTVVLIGDFKQFPAIMDHWAGSMLQGDRLENSHLLHDLVDGSWLELHEDRRSDPRLFDFYTSLDVRCTTEQLQETLQHARAQFPAQSARQVGVTHLVIPHKERRLRLNSQANLREKGSQTVKLFVPIVKHASNRNAPQDMWVWPGLRLIGAGGLLQKGCFYVVSEVSETCQSLSRIKRSR